MYYQAHQNNTLLHEAQSRPVVLALVEAPNAGQQNCVGMCSGRPSQKVGYFTT